MDVVWIKRSATHGNTHSQSKSRGFRPSIHATTRYDSLDESHLAEIADPELRFDYGV